MAMILIYSISLVTMNLIWLGLAFFALPGNWLIVITTCLFTWWRWDDGLFSIISLAVIIVLALLGELIEFLSGMTAARKAGGSRRSALGAIIGAIAGALIGTVFIPVPLLGTLIGAGCGAGCGAWALELSGGKSMDKSVRIGVGAGLGQFLGAVSKIALGIVIWLIVAVAVFWP